jgi:hypothetical protein
MANVLAESNQLNHVEYLESLARIGLVLRSERLQPQALSVFSCDQWIAHGQTLAAQSD